MTSRGRDQPLKSSYTDLEPKRIIGSGSFGKCFIMLCHIFSKILTKSLICSTFFLGFVFEAYDKESKQIVAVKRTQKAGEFVSREFEVLNRLKSCKNVVRMLEIYYSKGQDGKTA